jgi:hypothetical protein
VYVRFFSGEIGARMPDPTKVSRRLVAVFVADVEGYSRLMGALTRSARSRVSRSAAPFSISSSESTGAASRIRLATVSLRSSEARWTLCRALALPMADDISDQQPRRSELRIKCVLMSGMPLIAARQQTPKGPSRALSSRRNRFLSRRSSIKIFFKILQECSLADVSSWVDPKVPQPHHTRETSSVQPLRLLQGQRKRDE